jgi:hypothetical protein
MMPKGFGFESSPRSGRTKTAQRFIAGNARRARSKSVKRTAEMLAANLFRPFHGLRFVVLVRPSTKGAGLLAAVRGADYEGALK